MFNVAISNQGIPRYLSTDNYPLFRYHRGHVNLRFLGVDEAKSIPFCPTSHPFIERLAGTIRREYLDQLFFSNARDLERKLKSFAQYYNQHRVRQSLDGKTPANINDGVRSKRADLDHHSWQSHFHGHFQTPMAA